MNNDIKDVNGIGITKNLIGINYTRGMLIKPKYIVIHDISDCKFKTIREYRNYIANDKEARESVHYIVGAKAILKVLEDDWRGWHVGDKATKEITNSNSIAVAMFNGNKDERERVIRNTIDLVDKLRRKYDIPIANIKRHCDVTGKKCPKMLLEEDNWNRFIIAVKGLREELNFLGIAVSAEEGSPIVLREAPNYESKVIKRYNLEDKIKVYRYRNNWVKAIEEDENYIKVGYINKQLIKIKLQEKKDKILENREEVVEKVVNKEVLKKKEIFSKKEKKIINEHSNENLGINKNNIDYNKIITINKLGIVYNVDTNLNVRKGPGKENFVTGYLLPGQNVLIEEEIGDWYKIIYGSTIGRRSGYVEKEFVKLT